MVAGLWSVDACRCHTHVDEAEANCRLLGNHRPILQADKIDAGVGRRLLARGRVNDTDLMGGDMTGGVCGMWSLSPTSSCKVCAPGFRVISVSVCPAPK